VAPATKRWAVLVYFAADVKSRHMRKAAIGNLYQIAKIGSSPQVYVAAQLDLTGRNTRRYVFPDKTDGGILNQSAVAKDWPNINSGDPASLGEFLRWGAEACPAENYAVILWGHGYGLDDFNPMLPAPPPNVWSEIANVISHGDEVSVLDGALPTFDSPFFQSIDSLVVDDSAGSFLLNSDVARVVADWKAKLSDNQRLAILGLDCCEMAMLEVWDQMADCAEFGVASQFGIPYTSLPYDKILQRLTDSPQMSPRDFASVMVDTFIAAYDVPNDKTVVALSACDLGQTRTMEQAIKLLAEVLTAACRNEALRSQIFAARNSSLIFDADGFIDIGSFCDRLQASVASVAVRQACDGLRAMLPTFVSHSGFSPLNTKDWISLSTGVSVWFPGWIQYPDMKMLAKSQSQAYLRKGYGELKFAVATGWGLFLTTIFNYTRGNIDEARIMSTENAGKLTKDSDKKEKGKRGMKGHVPPKGKERIFAGSSSREAGVIVRASVEAFGPVGDTSLTITVNWPAGNVGPLDEETDEDEDAETASDKKNAEPGANSNATEPVPELISPRK
jgi:Clostripain family